MEYVTMAFICVTLIFVLCIVGLTIILYGVIAAAGNKEPAIFGRIGGGNMVRMLGIFMVIVAVVYLVLSGHLDEKTAAFFSAVGGFAFGGLERPTPTAATAPTPTPP
jgi:hypothetical protein